MIGRKLIVLAVAGLCGLALAAIPVAQSSATGPQMCPPGQSHVGNYCQHCPPGQSSAGNYCERCPPGQTSAGNYCEKINCPPGQALAGNNCEKEKGGGGGPPPPPPSCSVNAPQSAAAAAQAALTAVTNAGVKGLAATGRVIFSFSSQTCGGYRFILKVRNPKPGKHKQTTIGYVTIVNYLSTILQNTTKTVDVKINSAGKPILKYAKAHKLSLRTLVITHVRASNSSTSVQVINGILLK